MFQTNHNKIYIFQSTQAKYQLGTCHPGIVITRM